MYKIPIILFNFIGLSCAFAVPGHTACYYEDHDSNCGKHPAGWFSNDDNMVFKLLTPSEWANFQKMGFFKGSAHDRRDGFIHMSRGEQLDRVITKHYAKRPVYIVGFKWKDFGENLIWEDGYPHIYNSDLQINLVVGSYFYVTKSFQESEFVKNIGE